MALSTVHCYHTGGCPRDRQLQSNVSAKVSASAQEDGEITAAGLFGVQGIGAVNADITTTSSIKIDVPNATAAKTVTSAFGPRMGGLALDTKQLIKTPSTSKNNTPFSGQNFPKTVDIIVKANAESNVDIYNVPGMGHVSGAAFTSGGDNPKPYELSWATLGVTDFKITP